MKKAVLIFMMLSLALSACVEDEDTGSEERTSSEAYEDALVATCGDIETFKSVIDRDDVYPEMIALFESNLASCGQCVQEFKTVMDRYTTYLEKNLTSCEEDTILAVLEEADTECADVEQIFHDCHDSAQESDPDNCRPIEQ